MTNKNRQNWKSGNTAIEFALLSPILILMLAGAVDYGQEVYTKMQLQNGVRAAVQYMNATSDSANINAVIKQASRLDGALIRTAFSSYCRCATSTSNLPDCFGTCGDGSSVGHYWYISAEFDYVPLVGYFSSQAQTLKYSLNIRTTQ
ncbi:hypothetical protein WCLP8_4940024 [uncultured Gammaproteobacteria bacterium]